MGCKVFSTPPICLCTPLNCCRVRRCLSTLGPSPTSPMATPRCWQTSWLWSWSDRTALWVRACSPCIQITHTHTTTKPLGMTDKKISAVGSRSPRCVWTEGLSFVSRTNKFITYNLFQPWTSAWSPAAEGFSMNSLSAWFWICSACLWWTSILLWCCSSITF